MSNLRLIEHGIEASKKTKQICACFIVISLLFQFLNLVIAIPSYVLLTIGLFVGNMIFIVFLLPYLPIWGKHQPISKQNIQGEK